MSFKTSKYASLFSPQDLPGLAVWLDAADSTAVTQSGGSVSAWRGKSPLTLDMVQNTSGARPTYESNVQNGLPALRFTTSQMMQSTSNLTLPPDQTWFVSFRPLAGSNMIFIEQSPDVNTNQGSYFYGSNNALVQIRRGGVRTIFDASGVGATVFPLGSWYIASVVNSNVTNVQSNDVYWSINGARRNTIIDSNILTGSASNLLYINPTSRITASNYTGEILIYNRALPPSEVRLVERYLSYKWGVSLPTTHPFFSTPAVTRPFNPLDVSGCSLWLDADDNRTLTLSGSNVTQWNDKSGSGHTATASGSASPTYSSSSRYLLFNGTSNAFTLSTGALPSGNSAYSIFIVAYTNNAANPQWILSGGNESSNAALGVFFFTTNAVWHSWWFNEYAVNNSITNGVPSIINVNYTTTRTTITNGGTPTTNNPVTPRNNSTSNNFIGRLPNTVAQFLNGGIGEIVIFSREISTGERQQVELYLAEKWNLRPSLSSVNPLRLYRALSPVFNPTLISNCMVWLDAADSSRFTLTGSNVTTWLDKSGFGCNAIGSSNTGIYSSNGLDGKLPTVQFTPSNNMKVPAPSGTFPTGIAVFMVYQKTGANNTFDMGIARSQGGTPAPFDSYTVNIQQTHRIIGGTGGFPSNVETTTNLWRRTTPTALFMGIFSNTPTIWNESINGVFATYPTSPTTYADNADGIYIGARSDFTTVMRGNISEIIAYRVPSITTQQRQVVEAYLAKKWNIALPTTHPYYSTPV